MGRCDEASEVAARALSLAPESGRFYGGMADCLLMHRGDYQGSIDLFEKEPLGFIRETGLAIAYNKLGQQDNAQHHLETLTNLYGEDASYQYAQIYTQWGETEKALDALEHAWEIGDTGLIQMNSDVQLDPLRDEPRFIALLEMWRDPSKR